MILIESGGGEMQAEGFECAFSAPALLLIPAGYVHRFAWVAESRGHVVTIAQSYLAELGARYDEVQRIFERPAVVPADEATAAAIEAGIATLARELSWSARGRELAIDSALLGLLGLVVRQSDAAQTRQSPPRSGALVARFRELADRRFRTDMSVADYARALGVGESTLRTSCVAVTSLSPGRIVAQRRLLEAQRLLLYSTLTVAQVAHAVGFSDPAYFSRFFTLQAGCPPSHFRK
jgi:AraC family transcriptional activator of pobA